MDCCHSGTATRFFISRDSPQKGARPRFMTATADMVKVHRAARQQRGISRKSAYKSTSEILFSACRSNEVAWESDGQGDFTRHALAVLCQAGNRPLTCREFADAVSQRFQANRRQTPELCCDAPLEDTVLLGSRGVPTSSAVPPRVSSGTPPNESHLRSVLNEVRTLLESI